MGSGVADIPWNLMTKSQNLSYPGNAENVNVDLTLGVARKRDRRQHEKDTYQLDFPRLVFYS